MEGKDDGPSSDDIAKCAAVLQQLSAADLQHPELSPIREAGLPLFRRLVLKEKFGSEEVLDFLKKKSDVHQMTAKLQRLHRVVKDEHDARRQKAESCGMNLRRKADLAAIKAESQMPDEQCAEPRAADVDRMANTPVDSLYSNCNMCRGEYIDHHHFYHQLCPRCAEHNWEKRHQSADMSGMVCVVTGGRVRIGFRIVLKLLRAGAFVLTTTRYPNDCALRFSQESDYEVWRHRLEICGPLELCDLRLVERFCEQLARRFPRIHVLINNAAQTLTRREGWNIRMAKLETQAASQLPSASHAAIRPPEQVAAIAAQPAQSKEVVPLPQANAALWKEAAVLKDFPEGELDESLQPLDLSSVNSWSRRLEEVSTVELLQTLAANTAAPFIMCSKLANVLGPKEASEAYGHVVNVSALEGKFSVKNKSPGHPHTNMAKAALNMMTHTSCKDMFRRRILMNCVDTGWVTDMAPGGVGSVAATHETWVGPPLDEEDGAARVLDPVFSHLKDCTWLLRGRFFKNYYVAGW
ncbi:unnamed protein product [Effrenium voratum]|uniref:Uncharacterized protein n=1 Tax=Effrenium voratum TaxID=2562239 RepID=A0AA36HV14_9DINO|nr:unnamed protein product [Effrenium voratum]CAJ1414514.1 unnamed protein product [Effrenium voratum]